MAIYPPVRSQRADSRVQPEDIADTLRNISISVPSMVPLRASLPPDEHMASYPTSSAAASGTLAETAYGRRNTEPIRRDSLKRREALLRGREGSRRRQRWENDRLLNNPHAQPPLPSDWEVHPTYPRHATVPYFLAPLGDEMSSRQNKSERSEQRLHDGMGATKKITAEEERPPKVPQELRRKLKRAKSARGLLQELEQDIRRFVQDWEKHNNSRAPADDEARQIDSEDEEIVFVGRNGDMSDMLNPGEKSEGQPPKRDKLVIESLVEDRGASFRRWLVHSIATYYGLRTWSVTVGDPARREAYVGILHPRNELPRPLWGIV